MSPTLRLTVGGGLARAELMGRKGPLWEAATPCETPAELREAIGHLAGEPGLPRRGGRMRVVVTMGSPVVQVRSLRGLPPVRSAELRALVAAQAGRYFRRNGKPLVTDAAWLGKGARREGHATAVAVEEPWIDAVLDGAAEAGLEVGAIHPALESSGSSLSLISQSERVRRERRGRLLDRRLAVAAAAVWILCIGGLSARFEQRRNAVEAEIEKLAAPSQAVARARRSLHDASATVAALEEAGLQRGALLDRIGRIAAALPDSAYLASLTVDLGGNGSMTGEARHSSHALARLEAEGAILAPRPLGPVTSESDGGRVWEHFSIGFGAEPAR